MAAFIRVLALVSLTFTLARDLHAACASLVRGQVILDIQTCSEVQPEQSFASREPRYNFIRDLPPAQRKAFLDSYRGLSVKVRVARSFAIRSGLSQEQGALANEVVRGYILPQQTTCQAIQGKRLQAVADEVCCEGGGEAPCLLGNSLVFKKPTVIGTSGSRAGNTAAKVSQRPDYQKAQKMIAARDYRGGAAILQQLYLALLLDVQGLYLLASTYRELDKCAAAIPVLEELYRKFEKNDYFAEDEVAIRRGTLLYARCLSMQQRPDESVMILSSFLVEPKKYQTEIRESLAHPDFGYLRTTKAYLDYQRDAGRALGRAP